MGQVDDIIRNGLSRFDILIESYAIQMKDIFEREAFDDQSVADYAELGRKKEQQEKARKKYIDNLIKIIPYKDDTANPESDWDGHPPTPIL